MTRRKTPTRAQVPVTLPDSLLANLPGYVYRVANNPDYTPEFISDGVTAITGYAVDDYHAGLISCGKEIVPEDAARVWDEVQTALQAKRPYEIEYRIRTKTGEIRWVWERGRGVWSTAGELLYLEGFVTDVTARVQAEAVLREKERTLSESQRIAHIGSWLYDLTGRITWADETYHIFGVSSDTFTPNAESFINLIHPDDRAAAQAWISACVAEKIPGELRFRTVLPDGTVRFLSGCGELRYDAANRPLHMTGTVQDITEHEEATAALHARARQQEAAARIAQRALTASLPQLFDEATRVLAATLKVELCKVLQLLPDDGALRLVAGVGWRPGLVGQAEVSAGRDSQAGFTLVSDAPVIVEDLHTEERFTGPALLTEHGVVSGMSVVISDAQQAWGVLGAHTRERRRFTGDDVHFLETVAGVLGGAIQRAEAESALRESEERLSGILETNPNGVVLVNASGEVVFANAITKQLTELTPGRSYAKATAMMTTADGRPFAEDQRPLAIVLRTGQPVRDIEVTATRPDGTPLIFSINAAPMHDAAGTVVGAVGTATDITDRKQAEAALRASEQRYERLLESAPDATVVFDRTGRVVRANAQAVRLFGYTREEFLGLTTEDLMPSRYRGIHVHQRNAYVAAPRVRMMGEGLELWALRKDGGEFPCEISLNYDRDGDGVITLAAIRDITERRRAEVALGEAQERLKLAVQNSGVGLWDRDLRTNQSWRSPEWKRQIGYADEEIGADFNEWKSRVHPDDLGPALQTVQGYLDGALPTYEAEFRLRHKDGSYRHILARGAKLLGDDGAPARLLGSHVDITELKQLQAQFLQAQRMESVGRLAGGVAHDFNNLLTVINGVADLALMSLKNDDSLYADLRDIREAGERAATLTHQLLAFSRRQILKFEIVSLNTLVVGMESLLRRLIGDHIELVCVLAERLGGARADAGQIEQVILNLAVNARDAMPQGGRLTIETREVELDEAYAATHPSVQPGPHVRLAMSDTGIGMDEATRARVFEPFFTTKDSAIGTGLGLSTVYGIVKQSGGSIWVSSDINQGTTFTIYLPRVGGAAGQVRPSRIVAATGGTETILLVEDAQGVRDLARRILASAGYTVLTAGSGGEALLLLTRHAGPVHLMFTDVIMPGMSGRELAARVAELRPATKVLYTSGYTDDAILRHGVLEDATHFLGKPYTSAGLTRKVRDVLDSKEDRPRAG